MEGHARTWFTAKQRAELWERWKAVMMTGRKLNPGTFLHSDHLSRRQGSVPSGRVVAA